MSWLNVKLQTQTTRGKFSVSAGTPTNSSSSLRIKTRPDTRGRTSVDQTNTDGVLEDSNFSTWERFHKGGMNTLACRGNVLRKLTGYQWICALGKDHVLNGKARFEMIIRKKTGPIQVGIAHVGDREWVAESFFQDDFADRAWYVNGEGKIKTGGGKDRSLTKNHPNIEVDYRRARGDPQLEVAEGDVVGIAIDMDMGSVSFYKIKDKDKGTHEFAAPCAACGAAECRVWNERKASLGTIYRVMTYPDALTVGNLPVGTTVTIGLREGVWVTGRQEPDGKPETMESHVKKFFSRFAKVTRVVVDYVHKEAAVWMTECDSVDEHGRIGIDPMRGVLQALAGAEYLQIPEGHVFLQDWREMHPGGYHSEADSFFLADRGDAAAFGAFERITSANYEGPKENLNKMGPYLTRKTHRGHVTPGACMCKEGTEIELKRLHSEVDEARAKKALRQELTKMGIAPSNWSKSICATGIRILNNEATKTQKLPYFSTVFGSAYISRKYPPEPLEHGKRLFPGFEEVKLIDKQFSPDGWRPHEEGRWVSAAGGHWKWHPELRSQYINKRCWEVTIKQLGVWGKTYSSGICIGVAAFPSGGRGLGGDTFDLEHCWRWELQNDKVWYLDGSDGFDHLNKATGGCMYNGETPLVPKFMTGIKGGLMEGDVVSIEVDMGWQIWDTEDHRMIPRGKDYEHGGRIALDMMKPGSFSDTTTMLRFALNGKVLGASILEPRGLLGGKEGWPVHPAVCLQNEGDSVELRETHWSAWPCPHSALGRCPRCEVLFAKD